MGRTPVPSSHTLPDGSRVRLRLPRQSDLAGLRDLLARTTVGPDDLVARRLLRHDPRERCAVVAAISGPRGEEIVAYGAVDLRDGARPDVLIADETRAAGAVDLVCDVLAERVEDHVRRTA